MYTLFDSNKYSAKINILEDIEDDDDSFIIEHMETECNWNKQQCDKFGNALYKIITGQDKISQDQQDIDNKKTSTATTTTKASASTTIPTSIPTPIHTFTPFMTSSKPYSSNVGNGYNYNFDSTAPYRPLQVNFGAPFNTASLSSNTSRYSTKSYLKELIINLFPTKRKKSKGIDYRQRNNVVNKWGIPLLNDQTTMQNITNKHNGNKNYKNYKNNNNNNNNSNRYQAQTMKQAMSKHNYSIKDSKEGLIIHKDKSKDKDEKKTKTNNMNDIYAINDALEDEYDDTTKDLLHVDVETRARISLRKAMKQQFKDGTFHEKNRKPIFYAVDASFPFMDDNTEFEEDDDWSTANCFNFNDINDMSWRSTTIGNNKNFNNFVGLRNMGATCYMNAVLQAINCSDIYRNFLLHKITELKFCAKNAKKYKLQHQKLHQVQAQYSKQQRATVELKNLLRNLYEKKQRVISTRSFISTLPKRWKPGKQQDSNEFAKFILNCVWETIDQSAILKEIYDKLNFDKTEVFQLKQLRLDPYTHGMLNYTTQCLNCKGKSAKFEAFFDLSLALPNSTKKLKSKLQTKKLINDHMKPEKLSKDNQYFCNRCQKKTHNAMRYISIIRPPKILLIVFKRYQLDFELNQRQKIMTAVDCPLLLDIDRDIHDKHNNETVSYILYAVVVHNGKNAQCGHYYTIARNSNDAYKCWQNSKNIQTDHDITKDDGKENNDLYDNLDGGNWYRFDDALVTKSSYLELSQLSKRDTPYMLFYLRCDL